MSCSNIVICKSLEQTMGELEDISITSPKFSPKICMLKQWLQACHNKKSGPSSGTS